MKRRTIAVVASVAACAAMAGWFRWGRGAGALEQGGVAQRSERPTRNSAPAAKPHRPLADSVATREELDGIGLALHGRVLDELERPVARATVEARPERPVATTRTAGVSRADGSFELDVADASCTYELRVVADGFYPSCVDAVLPGSAPTLVRLRAAPSLAGSVRTTAGRAVGGARVRLLARTDFGEALELETRSDESGRYRLSGGLLGLEHLEDPTLEASAAGFAPSRVHLRDFAWLLTRAPALGVLERELVLSPGNRFAGRVVDDAGAPVADAELVVFTHAGRELFSDPYGTTHESPLGPTAIVTTYSAADGSFVLEGLPVRTGDGTGTGFALGDDVSMGSVRARNEGYALGGASLPWTKEGEPTEPLEIVLARGASFSGRVVDERVQPLDDVKVGINLSGVPLSTIVLNGMQPAGYGELLYWPPAHEDAKSSLWVRTGDDGRFRSPVLPCTPEGAISARIRLSWRGEYGEWRELELAAGEERELGDLVFERRHLQIPIEGVVLDPAGAPVAGAEVELQEAGMRRTGRDGRFRFEQGLEPGAEFPALDLEVSARGFVTHREVLRAAPELPLEIRLVAGLALQGTLSFQDGSPAALGTVSFVRPPQASRGFVWSDHIASTSCDMHGRFTFRELCAPPWVITYRIERPGFKLEDKLTLLEPTSELALVLPGNVPDFAALELVVTDVEVRPIDALQRPVLASDAGRIEGLRRDARSFVFPAVAPGRYVLRLGAPGFAAHEQELELAPRERARVAVALEIGTVVRVRVAPPPTELMSLRALALSAAGATRGGNVDAEGIAELGVLGPGAWTVGLVARADASDAPAWLGVPQSFEVAVGDGSLEWNLARVELGLVRLVLPVHGPDDPPIPVADMHVTEDGCLVAGDAHQAWWNAYHRSERRAQELTIELEDAAGAVMLRTTPERVELDARRNRVHGVVTAPVGSYTLALRRGAELLRRTPVQVLAETTVELDP